MNIGVEISTNKNSEVIGNPDEGKQRFFLHPSDKNLKMFVFTIYFAHN